MTTHANDTAWRIIRDLQGRHDDAQRVIIHNIRRWNR